MSKLTIQHEKVDLHQLIQAGYKIGFWNEYWLNTGLISSDSPLYILKYKRHKKYAEDQAREALQDLLNTEKFVFITNKNLYAEHEDVLRDPSMCQKFNTLVMMTGSKFASSFTLTNSEFVDHFNLA